MIHGAGGTFLAPGTIHGNNIGTAYVGGGGRRLAGFHTGIGPVEGGGAMDEDGMSNSVLFDLRNGTKVFCFYF